jgi:hypothetical protein
LSGKRKPIPVNGGVYASGDHAGVAFVGLKSGEMEWKTENFADRFVAVNDEHAYVRDRRGFLLVYDKRKADPITKRAEPLTKLDVANFTVPVSNDQTDRVFLASDNGLVICLRDAAAKYAKPLAVAPLSRQKPVAPVVPAVPPKAPN